MDQTTPSPEEAFARFKATPDDATFAQLSIALSKLIHAKAHRERVKLHISLPTADIAQETLMSLMEKLRSNGLNFEEYPSFGQLKGFLWKIMRDLAIDYRRKGLRRPKQCLGPNPPGGDDIPPEPSDPGASGVIRAIDNAEFIHSVMVSLLTDEQRQIVKLYALEGLTFEQVAARLGLSEKTIRTKHRAAMDRIALKTVELHDYGVVLPDEEPTAD